MKVQVVNKSQNSLPEYQTTESAGCDVKADLSVKIKDSMLFNAEYLDPVGIIEETIISEGTEKTYFEPASAAKVVIGPLGRACIPTGLHVDIPAGHEIQVRPRSGNALKYGITVLNTPGTIDADYRGNIGIILINLSNENFIVCDGDRIAQLVLNEVKQISWEQVESLSETKRSDGGFGSTGK